MQVRILGPLALECGGEPIQVRGRRQRAVAGVLALGLGRVVSAERLLAQCWPDRPPDRARAALQVAIVRLRDTAGADAIETSTHGYRLAAESEDIDAVRFEQQVLAGRTALAEGSFEVAVESLRSGLDLWQGQALEDCRDDMADHAAIEALERIREDAAIDLLEARLGIGHHQQAVVELADAVSSRPFDERVVALLMLAQYRSGRQGDALASARDLRRRLDEELGVDPGAAITELERRILRHDRSLISAGVEETGKETIRRAITSDRPAARLRLADDSVELAQAVTTIGRLEDRTLTLRDPDVSRRHAEVRWIRDRFVLFDVGSMNGTHVDGKLVTEHPLAHGDQIVVGGTRLVFEQPPAAGD